MDDNESRKNNAVLPDDALENVAGGSAQGDTREGMRPMDRGENRRKLPDEKAWVAVTARQ